jgi:branched-chain amino acid transport system permease protein
MEWVEAIVNGALLGGVYGMLGLGLALVFGIMRIVNIAHGDFIVAAAFVGLSLSNATQGVQPLLWILPIGILFLVLGYALQTQVLNRVVGRNPLPPLMLTFGIATMLRNLLFEVYGADINNIKIGSLPLISVEIGSLHVGVFPLLILLASILLFGGLALVMRYTEFGRIVRATADDHVTVQLFGVNYRRIYGMVMGISLALAAIAGLLMAMRSTFTPYSGVERLLIAFEVVIIGGLGSLWGSLAAGIALGVVQLVGLKWMPDTGLLFPHLLFFAILLILPNGLSDWRGAIWRRA